MMNDSIYDSSFSSAIEGDYDGNGCGSANCINGTTVKIQSSAFNCKCFIYLFIALFSYLYFFWNIYFYVNV